MGSLSKQMFVHESNVVGQTATSNFNHLVATNPDGRRRPYCISENDYPDTTHIGDTVNNGTDCAKCINKLNQADNRTAHTENFK